MKQPKGYPKGKIEIRQGYDKGLRFFCTPTR